MFEDARDGATYRCANGTQLVIPPSPARVFLQVWEGNGAAIDVLCYDQAQENADPSDRIHLFVYAVNGERHGYLLNAEDALAVIRGLSAALDRIIEWGDVPLKPVRVDARE